MFLKNFNNTPVKAPTIPKNTTAHNAIYRGKNIGLKYSIDKICSMISSGKFDDIFIGDYFDIEITVDDATEKVRCVIAALDPYYLRGDTAFTKHHAMIVTKNCVNTLYSMNDSASTATGYAGSKMFTEILPAYNSIFGDILGEHLLQYRAIISNSPTGAQWSDIKVSMLNTVQILGYKDVVTSVDNKSDLFQLPIFKMNSDFILCKKGGIDDVAANNRQPYNLDSIYNSQNYEVMSLWGTISNAPANNATGLRPTFLIG